MPGPLLAPTGLALVFVVVRIVTETETTTKIALPLVLVMAAAGFVLGRARLRTARVDWWAVAAVAGAFAVFGAPVFLSGQPSIAGSIVLPDTANQLVIAAYVADHGQHLVSLPPSSYQSILHKYLVTAYPVASQSTLGILAPLGVIDLAWLYQPFLTFAAAMAALSLYSLLSPVIERRPWRALAAFIAAQPALLIGYALQGSIKEVTGVSMLALAAAHAARAGPRTAPVGSLVPLAIALAAALGCLGAPAAAFGAPIVLAVLVVWGVYAIRARNRAQLIALGAIVAIGVVAALPVLLNARVALHNTNLVLGRSGDLGNLPFPLKLREVAGVWLSGDYRYPPDGADALGWALDILMLAAAVLGVVWMVRRRAYGPLLFVASLGLVAIPLVIKGSPYADAKVYAVVSPIVVLAAAVGVWGLRGIARGAPALVLAVVLAGGVLLSSAKAYHDSRHAPYDRYNELLKIDDRFAGQGPGFLSEYDEFGSYTLRKVPGWAEPERSHGWRTPALPTSPSKRPNIKAASDVEQLSLRYLESLPLLILRRSPVTSRPPANYKRVFHGRYYDVWRRERRPHVVVHLPLGDGLTQPAAVPRCSTVLGMGGRARRLGGRLAYVAVPRLPELLPLRSQKPYYWGPFSGWPYAVVPAASGEARSGVLIDRSARYILWLEGSFGRATTVYVDGRRVGQVAYKENNPGGHERVGEVFLRRGLHQLRVFRGGGDLRPGNGGIESSLRHLGPLVLSPPAGERRTIRYLDPARARRLCGQSLDWVEVVT